MSGYDIKKIVDTGLSHFWKENYGQIYPTLDTFVKDGLATKTVDPNSGKRKRHLYHISPSGLEAFGEWIAQPAEPPSVRNELQLKFFLSGKLTKKVTLRIIKEYRAQQEVILQDYVESEALIRAAIKSAEYPADLLEVLENKGSPMTRTQKAKQSNIFALTLRHGILAIEARLKWCDEVVSHFTGRS